MAIRVVHGVPGRALTLQSLPLASTSAESRLGAASVLDCVRLSFCAGAREAAGTQVNQKAPSGQVGAVAASSRKKSPLVQHGGIPAHCLTAFAGHAASALALAVSQDLQPFGGSGHVSYECFSKGMHGRAPARLHGGQ